MTREEKIQYLKSHENKLKRLEPRAWKSYTLKPFEEASDRDITDYYEEALEIIADYDNERQQEELQHEIEEGDFVDFGAYGRLYVVKKNAGTRGQFWVTDEREDREKKNARGWYISPSYAEKIIEKWDDAEDEDDDDSASSGTRTPKSAVLYSINNRWRFAGMGVPLELAYTSKDANLTLEEALRVPGKLKDRTWDTYGEAKEAAEKLGWDGYVMQGASGLSITEADEAKDKYQALRNLEEQCRSGETMGVIQMYEDAAKKLGASDSEIKNARIFAKMKKRTYNIVIKKEIEEAKKKMSDLGYTAAYGMLEKYENLSLPELVDTKKHIEKISEKHFTLDASERLGALNTLIKIHSRLHTIDEADQTAASGTKTQPMSTPIWQGGLYYLKLHNVIEEPFYKNFLKIVGYTKTGLTLHEASAIKNKPGIDFPMPFEELVQMMDDKKFIIQGLAYENERDKALLQNEINSIVKAHEIEEERHRAAEAEEDAQELAKAHEEIKTEHQAHKTATDDTIAGMEAMAGGWQGDKLPAKAEKFLSNFPDNATSWAQATDEIRDMARTAKDYYNEITLDVSSEDPKGLKPLDFKKLKTPSQWNTQGKKYIRDAYKKMNADARQQFLDRFSHWFGSDSAASGKGIPKPLSFDEWMEEQKEGGEHNLPSIGYKNYLKLFHQEHGIPNNYEGKTPSQVWEAWKDRQKRHFLSDHKFGYTEHSSPDIYSICDREYHQLPIKVQQEITKHVSEGSYAGGKGAKTSASYKKVPKDLTTDPYNRRGQTGQVIKNEEDKTTLKFFDGGIGYYQPEALESSTREAYYESGSASKGAKINMDDFLVKGARVKVLRGRYTGKEGKIVDWDNKENQVDVKMDDGQVRYLGFEDFEILDSAASGWMDKAKSAIGKAKEHVKGKIHDHNKKTAINVLDETSNKVDSKEHSRILGAASEIVEDRYSGGGQIKKTTKKKNFYHIRFRVPRGVETCRVPEYAKTIASTIHDGSKVTMCKFSGNYKLQKVLVPVKGVSKSEAESIAKKVADKLEPKK